MSEPPAKVACKRISCGRGGRSKLKENEERTNLTGPMRPAGTCSKAQIVWGGKRYIKASMSNLPLARAASAIEVPCFAVTAKDCSHRTWFPHSNALMGHPACSLLEKGVQT